MASPDLTLPAVAADRVSKTFELPREQVHTLKERALHPFRRSQIDTLRALREVSFQVEPGEFFGIVGRNGSGKSTLLKCLAGIYAADSGDLYVNGRLSAFIELGVGFNPDLAARENVLLNATMLGMSPREARKRVDSVIDFAELRDFTDLKVKNYSSGMLVRLAFATMVQVDSDILLIDEVLAVGDASFQQKCFDEFERIHREGKTVLLVTHDMGSVRKFCDRAMLLEKGRLVAIGDPEAVGSKYLELNFDVEARDEEAASDIPDPDALVLERDDSARRFGDGAAEVLDVWLEDGNGAKLKTPQTGHPMVVAVRVKFWDRVEQPRFTIDVQNNHRDLVFRATSEHAVEDTGVYEAHDVAVVKVHFGCNLGPDRYFLTVSVDQQGGAWLDRRERVLSFVVRGTIDTGALVQFPYDLDVYQLKFEAEKA